MSAQILSIAPILPPPSEQWLSQETVLAATGWTDRWLRRLVRDGGIVSRETETTSANGRPVREYLSSSLPRWAREKVVVGANPQSLPPSSDQAMLPMFPKGPVDELSPRVALPDPVQQAQAEERWQILRPVIEFRCDMQRFSRVSLSDGRAITSETRLMEWLCEQHDISLRTLKSWKSRYNKGGFPALADKPRDDKGKSRWMEQHPTAKTIVAAAYLESNRSKVAAYEALVRQCHLVGVTPDELPRYETVRAWLDSAELPMPMKVLAREGERRHNESCAPYLRRGYTDVAPNQIWVSDHMIHDVWVRNDCFAGVEEDAPMRLRLTCLLDMRSRKVPGYCWTPEGSSRSIATALRTAIARFGAPSLFYVDNGKDYQRVARGAAHAWERTSPDSQYLEDVEWVKRGLLYRLGIEVQHCIKYHPQSKHIERFFRTLHMRFDSLFAHYTTGNAYARPDETNVAMAEHAKLLREGRGKESALIPATEFIAMGATWIEREYNAKHSHRGQGMDGRTPNEVFDEGYPIEKRVVPGDDVLEQMLWEHEKRVVDSCAIRFNRRRYIGANEHSSAALYLANGTEVVLHYDPNDPEFGVVTDLSGHKIASVVSEQLTPHSADANEAIASSMQERRRLRNANAETIRTVRRQAAALGHKNGYQALREQALLPESVEGLINQRAPKPPKPNDNAVAPKSAAAIAAGLLEAMK
jgi:putative transposase